MRVGMGYDVHKLVEGRLTSFLVSQEDHPHM